MMIHNEYPGRFIYHKTLDGNSFQYGLIFATSVAEATTIRSLAFFVDAKTIIVVSLITILLQVALH